MSDEFSLVQFFSDGTYERLGERMSAEAAVYQAHGLCHSIGATLGTTAKVIITDSGDYTVFEWQHGKGVVFPPRPDGLRQPA